MEEKNKYDVAIYGLWYGNNYGSIITYYALSKVMEELGLSYAMIRNPLGRELDINSLERSHPLKFAKEKYKITKLRRLSELGELNEFFNAFLIGSDQMWNYNLSRPYKQSYFLDFADDSKTKIAYATSFGRDTYIGPDEEKSITQKNLKRFDAISVRDDFSKRICEDDFNVHAEIVLDPVFLCPVEKYDELISEVENFDVNEEYVFAYILDPNPQIGESIKKIAREIGKRVIVVFNQSGDKERLWNFLQITDKNINFIIDPTVKEWLYLFKNASFVLTDSFHGSCFSIIYRKPFIVKKNDGRGGSRFQFLLENFGLLDRMVESPEAIYEKFAETGINFRIDYEKVYNIINKEKERSVNWLKKALEVPHIKAITNVLDMKKCTGCSACANVCPADAITMKENGEGFLNPWLDTIKCINCGLCVKKCIALNPKYNNDPEPKCYAMMADDETRFVSSSGGMFTVAAEYILEQDGYVCGAAFKDDFSVEHIIIHDKKDLSLLRGSKYMQSHTNQIFKEIKKLLNEGCLVLFTGMPCQVAGLYSFLGKDYENLYTIDLLCHGITSSKVFEKYHKDIHEGKQLERLEFKAKEPWGWHAGVNAYFADGTHYAKPLENDMYYIAYLKSISKNTACEICNVNRLPRQGDLTIGDFWGIAKNDPEMNDKKGTSVVLVNNEKAHKLFDSLMPRMKSCKEEPLAMAIKGNLIIKQPYRLHKNRNAFFENFDKLSFYELTMGCFNNCLSDKLHTELLKTLSKEEIEYYYLAKAAAENSKGRKILTWIKSGIFERVLKKYFDLNVAFCLTKRPEAVKGDQIRHISGLKGRSNSYYIVGIDADQDEENIRTLEQYGFSEIRDYVFRKHKPIILEKYDCSKGNYSDVYGNTIEGFGTIIGRVVFRGGNNHIVIDNETNGINLEFNLTANSSIHIGSKCRFTAKTIFQTINYNGFSDVRIMEQCRFTNALFRLYNSGHTSSILINPLCTFESNIEFHANSGKKIIIGKDCMFSHNIDLWAGDGHTIFDVMTGENINSDYERLPEHRNKIVIGEHVWVGKGAFIMHGTDIANGSIIGAKSVVKGKFPNNCSIAGNPAKIVRENIAWSRDMVATDMYQHCGGAEYAGFTLDFDKNIKTNPKKEISQIEKSKIQTWLVTGGSTGLGKELVLKLHKLGYTVIATSRDIDKLNELPADIIKISLDVTDIESCQNAIDAAIKNCGNIDVLVNNAGISHMSTFEETPDDIAEKIIETNYWGAANMIKAILPHMRENRNGTVINISSASGFRPRNYGSYYVASKFAVENLTKNLKFECQRFMRFMAVEIGGMNTGLSKRQTVIHTKYQEYKNLPPIFPFKKGYSNNIAKIVDAIVKVASFEELPRDLILGWDAYQQFPQAIKKMEEETEKLKNISISTDLSNKDIIKLKDVVKPRNNNLKIQNWLITGASGGFGKILALRLHKLGYNIAVTSRDIKRLEDFSNDFIKIESSLENSEECDRVIKTAIEKMGSIDVLVNNATSNCWCSFEECPYDIMKKVFYVNYTLPRNLIKAVLPYMRENKNGTVVNITSIAGIQPRARVSTYSAAKAGLEGLTRTLKSECRNFARFMAVELVCMKTGIMIHNPVYDSQIPDYQSLGRYTPEINNIPNNKEIAAQQLINVVNQNEIPQSLLIGTESYMIMKNEIEKAMKDYRDFSDISLSVCDKI